MPIEGSTIEVDPCRAIRNALERIERIVSDGPPDMIEQVIAEQEIVAKALQVLERVDLMKAEKESFDSYLDWVFSPLYVEMQARSHLDGCRCEMCRVVRAADEMRERAIEAADEARREIRSKFDLEWASFWKCDRCGARTIARWRPWECADDRCRGTVRRVGYATHRDLKPENS